MHEANIKIYAAVYMARCHIEAGINKLSDQALGVLAVEIRCMLILVEKVRLARTERSQVILREKTRKQNWRNQ